MAFLEFFKPTFLCSSFKGFFICIGILFILSNYLIYRFDTKLNHYNLSLKSNTPISCVSLKNLGPWDDDVRELVKPNEDLKSCKTDSWPELFTTDLDSNLINLQFQDPELHCCYRPLVRVADRAIEFQDNCEEIKGEKTAIPPSVEYLAVRCSHEKAFWDLPQYRSRIVDFFPFLHKSKEIKGSQLKKSVKGNRPNVLIFGLDATSHLSFQRVYQSTVNFLRSPSGLNSFVFDGYNRVGDNTLPNMIPILTGLTLDEIKYTCWPSEESYFDNCHYIWQDFSDFGYRTSFAEDAAYLGMFDINDLRGFRDNPVDHQLHPLSHVQHVYQMYSEKRPPCMGSRIWLEDLIQFAKKVVHTSYKANQPFFHFSWATSIGHENNNNGYLGDGHLEKMLRWLVSQGHSNNTIIIIMSDHGARYGFMRNSPRGKIEENSPFLYISIPPWFRQKYPQAIVNLEGNQKILTSHWDLRKMLENILYHVENGEIPLGNSNSTLENRGISLFHEIPERNCSNAGIPDEFCICKFHNWFELNPMDGEIVKLGETLIEWANLKITGSTFGHLCVPLKLIRVIRAYRFNDGETEAEGVTIIIEVWPSGAQFEATFWKSSAYNFEEKWIFKGELSRTNKYGDQSHCVYEKKIKYLCLCKDRFIPKEDILANDSYLDFNKNVTG